MFFAKGSRGIWTSENSTMNTLDEDNNRIEILLNVSFVITILVLNVLILYGLTFLFLCNQTL